jgi:hypothetical protein
MKNQKAKTRIVKYKGVEYKVRTLEVRDNINGEVLTSTICLAPIELDEAYDNDAMSVHGSKEQILDASIDHYVTKEIIDNLPDVVTPYDMSEVMAEIMNLGIEVEEDW